MDTSEDEDDDERPTPSEIRELVARAAERGSRILVTPGEITALLDATDAALDEAADDEHEAVLTIREVLAEIIEDHEREHRWEDAQAA